jgi:hypothetical protein
MPVEQFGWHRQVVVAAASNTVQGLTSLRHCSEEVSVALLS